jgi:hypothetical protein
MPWGVCEAGNFPDKPAFSPPDNMIFNKIIKKLAQSDSLANTYSANGLKVPGPFEDDGV